MQCRKLDETAPETPPGNVIEFRPYQRKAEWQRRWAWCARLLFGMGPECQAEGESMPAVGSGEVLNFRRHAGAARW